VTFEERNDEIQCGLKAFAHVDSVTERIKEMAVDDAWKHVGDFMRMVADAYRAGWIAGQEKQNAEIRADFVGGSPAGVQASC
jgi:hypothetical protein